jgi:Outer membrane protein and related peptidoglycan-associated (lipo)proteins
VRQFRLSHFLFWRNKNLILPFAVKTINVRQKITTAFLLLFSTFIYSQENRFQVFFDFDISETNTTSSNKLSQWISENPTAIIDKIYGYCDAVGTMEYNDALSVKRAEYVLKTLKANNIKINETVELKGFGEQFAQATAQEANRKVTVYYTIPQKEALKSKLSEEIKTLKIGDKLTLKNLNFYDRSGIIVPASEPILRELLAILTEKPNLKIEIQGHICCQLGTDLEDIATIRAKAIYNFLIANGISSSRLKYKGFGSTRPIHPIPEKNEQERNENRRVEILVLQSE